MAATGETTAVAPSAAANGAAASAIQRASGRGLALTATATVSSSWTTSGLAEPRRPPASGRVVPAARVRGAS